MSRQMLRTAAGAALVLLALPAAAAAQHATYDSTLWSGMQYRMIGPFRGGRVTAVTGVASEPRTFYMGSTGGGVWKTTDAGAHAGTTSPTAIFAVALDGRARRGALRPQRGLRRHRLVEDPQQRLDRPRHLQVHRRRQDVDLHRAARRRARSPPSASIPPIRTSCTSRRWATRSSEQRERGVYRTTDGGKTWKKVLYISDSLRRGRPRTAARQSRTSSSPRMWHGQRKPWTIISGARRRRHLQEHRWRRHTGPSSAAACPTSSSGAATSRSRTPMPNRIYALIEAKPGSGLYRSEDAGATWTLVNGAGQPDHAALLLRHARRRPEQRRRGLGRRRRTGSRAPTAARRSAPRRTPHGDNHDIWINPKNSRLHDPVATTAARTSRSTAAGPGARSSTSPPPRSIRWRWTTSIPIASTARSRTTPRVIVPSLPLGNGQDFRDGPGCETGPIIPDTDEPRHRLRRRARASSAALNLKTANEEQLLGRRRSRSTATAARR